MLQRPVFRPAAARLSSHFKQRTRPGANPAAMLDSIINASFYQEQCCLSVYGIFPLDANGATPVCSRGETTKQAVMLALVASIPFRVATGSSGRSPTMT
jgi:hypothetical protein